MMAYLIGVLLALAVAVFAAATGLDRERGFYPTITIVIAAYYDLFAVVGGSGSAMMTEVSVSVAFAAIAIVGFRVNLWCVVLALAGHGVFDAVHGRLITNPGVPTWWPAFCMAYDVAAAGCFALQLKLSSRWDGGSLPIPTPLCWASLARRTISTISVSRMGGSFLRSARRIRRLRLVPMRCMWQTLFARD